MMEGLKFRRLIITYIIPKCLTMLHRSSDLNLNWEMCNEHDAWF